jgi:hypothetical protein
MTPFGSLAKSSWISVAVWLATFSFRLIMYRQGTEADWTFLDLFKLHSPGLSRTVLCCHASDQDVMRYYLYAESLADTYCLTTIIGIV